MGPSQGSVTAPIGFAAEPLFKAAFYSGGGGGLALALLNKTEPVDIRLVVQQALRLEDDEVNEFNPIVALLQNMMEPADSLNYARYHITEPAEGLTARHVHMTNSEQDSYSPPQVIEAMAVATGLDLVKPVLVPFAELAFGGGKVVDRPATNEGAGLKLNKADPLGNQVTGYVTQYDANEEGANCSDGHFVIYCTPNGNADVEHWWRTYAENGVPEIGALGEP